MSKSITIMESLGKFAPSKTQVASKSYNTSAALTQQSLYILKALNLPAVLSFLLLFVLSIDTLPLHIRAEYIPLADVLAVLFLPFFAARFRVTPLFTIVLFLCGYILTHGLIALFIEFVALGEKIYGPISFSRQAAALFLGLSLFFVLRKIFTQVSNQFIAISAMIGAFLPVTVSIFNLIWGITGSALASKIVKNFRTPIDPRLIIPFRADGLSLEPSTFASYLALIVFPFALILIYQRKTRIMGMGFLLASAAAFLWTFSTVGFITAFIVVFLGAILGPARRFFVTALLLFPFLFLGAILFFHKSYMSAQFSILSKHQHDISFTDRFDSFVGPYERVFSSYDLFGYGLGESTTHFKYLVPKKAEKEMAAENWSHLPELNSLGGRLLAEEGIIGVLLAVLVIFTALKEVNASLKKEKNDSHKFFLYITRIALLATIASYCGEFGSYAVPYLWFWLAVIDSRYIRSIGHTVEVTSFHENNAR